MHSLTRASKQARPLNPASNGRPPKHRVHADRRSPGRLITRLAALATASLAAVGLTIAAAAPAVAHDVLVGYAVEADDATGAAEAFVLSFNNEVLDVGTEIVVTGPDGADATGGDPSVAGRDVTQPLAAPLTAGNYSIVWRVVSSDGHPIQGTLTLEVSETGAGVLTEETDGDGHDHDHDHGEEHSHGDADHDHGDDHGDEAVTPLDESSDNATAETGQPWWFWVLVGIGGAGVIAAIVTASVVGAKRRRSSSDATNSGAGGAE